MDKISPKDSKKKKDGTVRLPSLCTEGQTRKPLGLILSILTNQLIISQRQKIYTL